MSKLELRPSESLVSLMKRAADTLTDFGQLWNEIKIMGDSEGFTEKELQQMLRPLLKPQLTKDQIYYLFNTEQQKERVKEQSLRKLTPVNHNEVIEQLDTQPVGKSIAQAVDVVKENLELKQEIDHLKKTAYDLREVVSKKAIETGDTVETNFERIFEMLPGDDVDTFKNKGGTLMLLERVLVNFKYQDISKRCKYQWWVRRVK